MKPYKPSRYSTTPPMTPSRRNAYVLAAIVFIAIVVLIEVLAH